MRDDETRSVPAQLGGSLLDQELGARVDRTGGLVEDEQARLGEVVTILGALAAYDPDA